MALNGEEQSGSSTTSPFSSEQPQDDHAPLWTFVTIKDKIEDGGGNKLWSCNFCEKVVKSSYSRAEDLVYVHSNLRLLSRKDEGYTKGETRMWDVSGDVHDALDGTAGLLESAELSLDEPELEAMLFLDDGNGGEENDTVSVRQ